MGPPRLVLLLVSCLAFAACGAEREGVRWSTDDVVLLADGPTTLTLVDDGLPIVEGRVDGHPVRLVLDTGAESTLLDLGFAERVGLPVLPLAGSVTSDRGGEVVRRYEWLTRVERMELGDAAVGGLTPLLFDMGYLGGDFDGIVGMDVLGLWATVFDAEVRRVHVVPGGALGSSLGAYYAAGTRLEGWAYERDGVRPFLALDFEEEGVHLDALIDTGAGTASLPEDVVSALDLERAGSMTSRHIGGVEEEALYRMPPITFGDTTVSDALADADPHDHAILGFSFLRHYVFVVDGSDRSFAFVFAPERVARDG